MTSEGLSEFDLIARLFEPLTHGHRGALGLLDDAAILAPQENRDRVITTDALVCGIHFRPEDPPASVAAKALGVNLSDLASMGATPDVYTLSLIIPKGTNTDWLEGFARHLALVQDTYAITLIGGDTVSTPGPLTISITALGHTPCGSSLQRSGAQPGDDIYVSGTIGDAALGLKILQGTLDGLSEGASSYLPQRYQFPEPRIQLGQALNQNHLASACCDISDGLLADLENITKASRCHSEITVDDIPLSKAAKEIMTMIPTEIRTIVTGGDDYELLFTAPSRNRAAIDALGKELSMDITRIGQIKKIDKDTNPVHLKGNLADYISSNKPAGYIHRWQ